MCVQRRWGRDGQVEHFGEEVRPIAVDLGGREGYETVKRLISAAWGTANGEIQRLYDAETRVQVFHGV